MYRDLVVDILAVEGLVDRYRETTFDVGQISGGSLHDRCMFALILHMNKSISVCKYVYIIQQSDSIEAGVQELASVNLLPKGGLITRRANACD